MKTLIIILQLAFLAFIVWEFIFAKQLPGKYSRLKPAQIRLVDTAIAIMVLLTIWYLVK
jgi:hypothetical protein